MKTRWKKNFEVLLNEDYPREEVEDSPWNEGLTDYGRL